MAITKKVALQNEVNMVISELEKEENKCSMRYTELCENLYNLTAAYDRLEDVECYKEQTKSGKEQIKFYKEYLKFYKEYLKFYKQMVENEKTK